MSIKQKKITFFKSGPSLNQKIEIQSTTIRPKVSQLASQAMKNIHKKVKHDRAALLNRAYAKHCASNKKVL